MDIVEIVQANLLTPIVLFFVLGVVAARIKSDLRIPDQLSAFLPIYLLAAIGLHGGIEMKRGGLEQIAIPIAVAVALALVMTLNHYQILRRLGKFNIFDSYALASTYGSVGAVTFSVGLSFLRDQNITSEGYITAILAVLEPMSLVFSIFLVNMTVEKELKKRKESFAKTKEHVAKPDISYDTNDGTNIDADAKSKTGSLKEILRETITGKAIVILLGCIIIGYIIGDHGFVSIKPVFEDLFFGALVIFILEMGILAGQRLNDIKKVGPFLIAFAILIPTLNGTIGVIIANYLGLSIGGAVMFGVLFASASFIAAPAVLRTGIPRANPSLYITSALGITFPYIIIALLPILLIISTTFHNLGSISLFG